MVMIRRRVFNDYSAAPPYGHLFLCFIIFSAGLCGCSSSAVVRQMEVTAYCGCGQCCRWERGSWKCLKLNFWNRYISGGKRQGMPYSGLTASGAKPHEPRHGLFSVNSLTHPWKIPFRIFFPWLWFSRDGTIAADTRYYGFGTRMYIDGYGYGVVEDRGSAVKGPDRIDLFFNSHAEARQWGRRQMKVHMYQ